MTVIGAGIMGLYLIVAAFTDIKTKYLNHWFLLAGIIPAILLRVGVGNLSLPDTVGGLVLGAFFVAASWLSGGRLGKADGIILLYLGVALGFTGAATLAVIAFFMSALVMIVLMLMKKITMKGSIPFVPFLLAAYIPVMFLQAGVCL